MIAKRILQLTAIFVLGMVQFGASCVSDDGGYDRDDDGYDSRPIDSDYDRPRRIPRSADLVRDDVERLRWRADLDGEIFVYDVGEDRVVYRGTIQRGQEIVVEPGRDRVSVDERVVLQENLRRDARHQVYFAPQRRGDDRDDRDDSNGIPRDAGRMARGSGNIKIDRAPADGRVFVYDDDDNRLVYSREIKRGNSFQIFPDRDYVNVNSKRADEVRLADRHRHSLYFRQR